MCWSRLDADNARWWHARAAAACALNHWVLVTLYVKESIWFWERRTSLDDFRLAVVCECVGAINVELRQSVKEAVSLGDGIGVRFCGVILTRLVLNLESQAHLRIFKLVWSRGDVFSRCHTLSLRLRLDAHCSTTIWGFSAQHWRAEWAFNAVNAASG